MFSKTYFALFNTLFHICYSMVFISSVCLSIKNKNDWVSRFVHTCVWLKLFSANDSGVLCDFTTTSIRFAHFVWRALYQSIWRFLGACNHVSGQTVAAWRSISRAPGDPSLLCGSAARGGPASVPWAAGDAGVILAEADGKDRRW